VLAVGGRPGRRPVYNFQRVFNLKMGFGTREHDYGPYRAMGPVTAEEYESRAERYDTQLKDEVGFVPRVVDRIASSLDPGFRMYFDGLAASQQRLLVHVAVRGGEALLSEKARHEGRLGSPSTVSSALAALEEKDVLSRRDDGWGFVNPGFALWIRECALGN